MYNIMTAQDYNTLISMSELKGMPVHAHSTPFQLNREDIEKSKNALAKIGFIQNNMLTDKGKAIIEALLTPDKTVVTANTALVQQAPVTYCYKHGYWTVLAVDLEIGLITLISPVFQQEVTSFAKQNLLYDLSFPSYRPYSITLEDSEWFLLELTFLAVIQKYRKKNEPLSYEESGFSIDDLFSTESQLYMATSSNVLNPQERDKAAELMKDETVIKKALAGLHVKGLLQATGTKENMEFRHTQTTRERFMAHGLSDKVTIAVALDNISLSYIITASGLMKVTTQNKQIRLESVPDIDWTVFDQNNAKKSPRFCSNCGAALTQGSKFCSGCGKKLG